MTFESFSLKPTGMAVDSNVMFDPLEWIGLSWIRSVCIPVFAGSNVSRSPNGF
jgi:hypothetical protein